MRGLLHADLSRTAGAARNGSILDRVSLQASVSPARPSSEQQIEHEILKSPSTTTLLSSMPSLPALKATCFTASMLSQATGIHGGEVKARCLQTRICQSHGDSHCGRKDPPLAEGVHAHTHTQNHTHTQIETDRQTDKSSRCKCPDIIATTSRVVHRHQSVVDSCLTV